MADRDVKVKLSIEAAGDQAARSMKDIATGAKDAAAQVKQLAAEQAKLKQSPAAQINQQRQTMLATPASTDPFQQVKQVEAQRQSQRQSQRQPMPAPPPPYQPPQAQQQAKMPAAPDAAKQADPAKMPAPAQAKPQQSMAEQFGFGEATLKQAAQGFAAIKIAAESMKVIAKGVDLFNDETLSTSKKLRKLGESLPIVGEAFTALGAMADSISGKTKALRDISRKEAITTAEAEAGSQQFSSSLPVRQQLATVEARAAAIGPPMTDAQRQASIDAIKANAPSRDTAQGELAYQQAERRRPLEADRNRATQEAQASQSVFLAAKSETDRIKAELAKVERQRAASEAKASAIPKDEVRPFGATGNAILNTTGKAFNALATVANPLGTGTVKSSFEDTTKLAANSDVKNALEQEIKLRQQLSQATATQADAARQAAEAESKARRANLALAKEELASIKERAAQVQASSQAFGSLSAVDKQAALESAQQLKQGGYDTLTPEQKAALQGAGFGNVLNAAATQSAQNSPAYQQIAQLLGQEFDLKGLQKQEIDLQAKIEVDLQIDEQKLATDIKTALEPLLNDLLKGFEAIALAQVKKVKVGQQQNDASQ